MMLKLSKSHSVIKTAEEDKEDKAEGEKQEDAIQGSDLDGDADDLSDGLEEEGAEGEDGEKATDELAATKHKFDARREAATPHAHAAKDLFAKRREFMTQVNALDDQLSKHREVLRALDPKMKHEAYADDKELRNYLKPEKMLELKKKKKKLDKKSESLVVDGLLKVADVLDYAGHREGVTLVENVIRIFAKNEEMPKYDVQTIEKTPREYPEIAPYAPTMSTRGCPDHNGAQMQRIAEGSFQCELDGRVYNWNQGFKDYAGNVFPAAPITSVDFPDSAERLFENRQMATSKRSK
jgi:hypothetical protein